MVESLIGKKLRAARKEANLTQEQLGKKLKLSGDYISRIEKGERTPSDIVMEAIDEFISSAQSLDNASALHEMCKVIDIYNMVEGGPGAEPEWHEPIDRRAIPSTFLRPNVRAVLVRGRSMEPTFKNGAIIGIDQNERQVIEGETYAIVLPYSGAAVKRLYPLPDGVLIRSDNQEFPEVKLRKEDIPDYFILGRVCWVIQEV